MPSEAHKAVVIGGYVNGLGLVRSLGARGIRTAVVTTQPYDIAQRSRFAAAHARADSIDTHPERLLDVLERRRSDWRGAALLPSNDEALAVLAEHAGRLADDYHVVAPPPEAAQIFLDKERMLATAEEAGLALPRCYGAANATTAESAQIAFPVVVKPNVGFRFVARFGCKLFAARDRGELRRAVGLLAAASLEGRVYDLIPGRDDRIYVYCTYVDARGEPGPGVTIRKIRQSPPFFGIARVAEVIEDQPLLRDATVELLRRIGHRGIAIAEFKLDPRDGSFRFLEINGRSVVFNALLRRAGLDLAALAYTDFVCGKPVRAEPKPWPGAWINLHADLLYAALHRREDPIGLTEFLAPYRRPRLFAVWSASDPAPALAQWGRTGREGARALLAGTVRERVAAGSRYAPERAVSARPLAPPAPTLRSARSDATARNFPP